MVDNKTKVENYMKGLMESLALPDETRDFLTDKGFVFVEGEIEDSVLWYNFEKRQDVKDKAGAMQKAVFELQVGYEQDPMDEPMTFVRCRVGDLVFGIMEGIGTDALFSLDPDTVEELVEWTEIFPREYATSTYEEWEDSLNDFNESAYLEH